MYKPIGQCLNDFDISYNLDLERYELIHIQGPPLANSIYDATIMETSYGNAVSQDLINWSAKPNVFGISENECSFDNSAIWTMHTLYSKDTNERLMFYTGLGTEAGFAQKIGLAQYDRNTKSWKRLNKLNPIVCADQRWYLTEKSMAWRDPYVFWVEELNQYAMLISAKEKFSDKGSGCVAIATSDDLLNWEIKAPLLAPRKYDELEVPVYLKLGQYHYLITSVWDINTIIVWRSQEFFGPYEECPPLCPKYDYAGKVINYKGQNVLLHTKWVQRRDPEGKNVWSRGYLDNPKVLLQDKQGYLRASVLS